MRIGPLNVSLQQRRRVSGGGLESLIRFTCPICGAFNEVGSEGMGREVADCVGCRSTVRFRSIVFHLLRELGIRAASLADAEPDAGITGIGLSDWVGYAKPLGKKFLYTNTRFDAEPRLDITHPETRFHGTCDFLIASDVFEHVLPPVARAFTGAAQVLKTNGVLLLTVPFIPDAETVEHYPDATGYHVASGGAVSIETAGQTYRAEDPRFHGGLGATLEMRLFGSTGLRRSLEDAGFVDITFHYESCLSAGILHTDLHSVPVTARKR